MASGEMLGFAGSAQPTGLACHRARQGVFRLLRLYAPTEAAINKSWKPGDIEKQK